MDVFFGRDRSPPCTSGVGACSDGYHVDGSQYLRSTGMTATLNDFTLSLWVNLDVVPGNLDRLISFHSGAGSAGFGLDKSIALTVRNFQALGVEGEIEANVVLADGGIRLVG